MVAPHRRLDAVHPLVNPIVTVSRTEPLTLKHRHAKLLVSYTHCSHYVEILRYNATSPPILLCIEVRVDELSILRSPV